VVPAGAGCAGWWLGCAAGVGLWLGTAAGVGLWLVLNGCAADGPCVAARVCAGVGLALVSAAGNTPVAPRIPSVMKRTNVPPKTVPTMIRIRCKIPCRFFGGGAGAPTGIVMALTHCAGELGLPPSTSGDLSMRAADRWRHQISGQ
jgi:hypothetical protein